MKQSIPLSALSLLGSAVALPRSGASDHVVRQETGLNAAMQAHGKYFGTFSDGKYLDDAPYTEILAKTSEFEMITPGNSMKWDTTEASEGSFNFDESDSIVQFASEHGQTVRGHTLVWHSQLPSWVSDISDPETLTNAMNNHIETVMTHFEGETVAHWDVVNEPFEDNGEFRDSVFYNLLGKDFIASAFRKAREVSANATLYLNEYNNDFGDKGDAFFDLAKELKDAGEPIDGVGIQGHYILGGIPSGLQERMQALADLDLDVAITELDIRIESPTTEEDLEQQSKDYAAVISACLAVERCVGVSVASFTDKYSWVPDTFEGYDDALPWDKDLQTKPAYDGILNATSS
ncbi:hypothetical protein FQN54_007562 [Arachnomyces sp. PD_36]|nr:hypothetical protein FQN54_007562 [Arachnomyces sp. PD_36]